MEFISVSVTSSCSPLFSERRFNAISTVGELKNKCELLTGTAPVAMKIQLLNEDNVLIKEIDDDLATLKESGIKDRMIIHVIDKTGGLSNVLTSPGTGDGALEKFELTEQEYDERPDSVKAWKQKMGLGRFDKEKVAKQKATQDALLEEGERLAAGIKVSDRCEVKSKDHPVRRGTVAFVGPAHFKPGPWIGIQFDEPVGRHNGSVDGKTYFTCPDKYGAFVRPQDVTVGDFPEEDFEDCELDEI